jgi:hypothetical protein
MAERFRASFRCFSDDVGKVVGEYGNCFMIFVLQAFKQYRVKKRQELCSDCFLVIRLKV